MEKVFIVVWWLNPERTLHDIGPAFLDLEAAYEWASERCAHQLAQGQPVQNFYVVARMVK